MLQTIWQRFFPSERLAPRRGVRHPAIEEVSLTSSSGAVLLVLRRMRAPLIALIVIYAVSVIGLTLVPGVDPDGRPWRMSFFHAFYFMSYTATTIGFGEIPYPFSDAQRLWVTGCIYLTVIGWAYAIGTLLALSQDRAFRRAIATQSFARRVRRLREPFFVVAGYGQTGRLLGRALDALGLRFVVVDVSEAKIEEMELHDYRIDVPALASDARNPEDLRRAGLDSPHCAGLFALTDDDEANLAAAMAGRLLQPGMPVLARTLSDAIGERMQAIGTTHVVNPFDRFGDYLALAVRAPSAYRLMEWLTAVPGTELGRRRDPPHGRYVICGYGRFGSEVAEDLRRVGLEVTIVEPKPRHDAPAGLIRGLGTEPDVLLRAGIRDAVGLIAGTDNDTTNLSVIAAGRRLNGALFVVARQNRQSNAALFDATPIDYLVRPSEVIAHECLARLTTPMLMRFLDLAQQQPDAWSADAIERLTARCGTRVPLLWKVRLVHEAAPSLARRLADTARSVSLGDILRDPTARDDALPVVALMLMRAGAAFPMPADDLALAPGDEILFAGRRLARRRLADTLERDGCLEYVLTGRDVPTGWLWRRFSGASAGSSPR